MGGQPFWGWSALWGGGSGSGWGVLYDTYMTPTNSRARPKNTAWFAPGSLNVLNVWRTFVTEEFRFLVTKILRF